MGRVRSQGIEIAYETAGDGPAVVLLHSFLCSGAMWEHQVGPLAANHKVVNVDCRGHGASGRITGRFTIYDLVADAVAVLDDLGIERAVWAGLSIGGMTALRAALVAPERVDSLILIDTSAERDSRSNGIKYAFLGAIARTVGMRPVLPQVARQMFGATTLRKQQAMVEAWVGRFAQVDVPSALLTLKALMGRDDLTPRLAEIDVPALVVVGSEDRSLPPDRSRRLAAGLPRARLVEVPEAGHLSALEQPELVTRAMLDFLARKTD